MVNIRLSIKLKLKMQSQLYNIFAIGKSQSTKIQKTYQNEILWKKQQLLG